MIPQALSCPPQHDTWQWPLNLDNYDRTPVLSEAERVEIDRRLHDPLGQLHKRTKTVIRRLLLPLYDVLELVHARRMARYGSIRTMLIEMHRRQTPYWAWSAEEWAESVCSDTTAFGKRYGWNGQKWNRHPARGQIPLFGYLFGTFPPSEMRRFMELVKIVPLARKVFGRESIDSAVQRLTTVLQGWGYQQQDRFAITTCVCYLFLQNRSPLLEALSFPLLEAVDQNCALPSVTRTLFQVSRALVALGYIEQPLPEQREVRLVSGTDGSVDDEWLSWCQRWLKYATQHSKKGYYYTLLKVGRWLRAVHPEVRSPAEFTIELAAEFVAATNDMKVGDWSESTYKGRFADRLGKPLRPRAKERLLVALRAFLRDCQEWQWIPVQFNPLRVLRTPQAIGNLIGPDPRVVDKSLWAKLLWAAMNLEEEDLPKSRGQAIYPLEMVRAIAVVWCFAALRSNEIIRLRVGCVRWQYEDVMIPETGAILPKDAVCFLDIPINKTMTAYTKPVHPLVGKRINEWERVRPDEQPRALDKKTSETGQFLFTYRGRRLWNGYINRSLIPMLCRKSGIPLEDSRGKITSHRARATIASMLYNAKEPLTIYELMHYLGHKKLSSTQSYLQVDPTRLASRVAQAGYLEQNLATIEVLLDQDAVRSGAAARGETWKYYDLGHGWCTNDFWAECKHRMACARCPFYRPKNSTVDQLIEGKANLVRMLEFVQLTEEEKVLVTEGIELQKPERESPGHSCQG
jgi:integrase